MTNRQQLLELTDLYEWQKNGKKFIGVLFTCDAEKMKAKKVTSCF